MIPTPKGFLGSGQPTGLPPKPDLSRYTEPSRYRIEKITPTREPQALPVEEPAPEPPAAPEAIKRRIRRAMKASSVSAKNTPQRSGTTRGCVLEVLYEQKDAISAEDVALECWKRWPEKFGMTKTPQHPCTNSVYAKLASLTTDGLVHRPVAGMVRITLEGASAYTRGWF